MKHKIIGLATTVILLFSALFAVNASYAAPNAEYANNFKKSLTYLSHDKKLVDIWNGYMDLLDNLEKVYRSDGTSSDKYRDAYNKTTDYKKNYILHGRDYEQVVGDGVNASFNNPNVNPLDRALYWFSKYQRTFSSIDEKDPLSNDDYRAHYNTSTSKTSDPTKIPVSDAKQGAGATGKNSVNANGTTAQNGAGQNSQNGVTQGQGQNGQSTANGANGSADGADAQAQLKAAEAKRAAEEAGKRQAALAFTRVQTMMLVVFGVLFAAAGIALVILRFKKHVNSTNSTDA